MICLVLQISLIPVFTEAPVRKESNPLPVGQIIYCNNLEHEVVNVADIPAQCKKYMFSIGTAIQNKALGKSVLYFIWSYLLPKVIVRNKKVIHC